ncbi:MAG: crosslink repair DNA glycosylase YcaQ family protein [Oscillibacter sp.]
MNEYVVNRPDEARLNRILAENSTSAAGAILHLAWQAGLLREEIVDLSWAQVDLVDRQIRLPGRVVPLSAALFDYLRALREERTRRAEWVVLSDRDGTQLAPQSVSRLARTALDKGGQEKIRLIDLRHDFVLRQLAQHDWQYVSRITGVEAAALNAHFGAHLSAQKVSTRISQEKKGPIDEFKLWKLIQDEALSPVGVALTLTWQLGLQLDEIIALRWDQVDPDLLRLPGRDMPLSGGAQTLLCDLRAATPITQQAVLIAPRSRKPFDRTRLSRLVRAALIRSGLDNVTLRDLRMDCDIRAGGENQVLQYVKAHGCITRAQMETLLGLGKSPAYNRLRQMVSRGRLTQIGGKYYLAGTVVPPAEQAAVILEYLAREGFAYRQDIARLLRLDVSQCRGVLKRMVDAGQITQVKQKYLPA